MQNEGRCATFIIVGGVLECCAPWAHYWPISWRKSLLWAHCRTEVRF